MLSVPPSGARPLSADGFRFATTSNLQAQVPNDVGGTKGSDYTLPMVYRRLQGKGLVQPLPVPNHDTYMHPLRISAPPMPQHLRPYYHHVHSPTTPSRLNPSLPAFRDAIPPKTPSPTKRKRAIDDDVAVRLKKKQKADVAAQIRRTYLATRATQRPSSCNSLPAFEKYTNAFSAMQRSPTASQIQTSSGSGASGVMTHFTNKVQKQKESQRQLLALMNPSFLPKPGSTIPRIASASRRTWVAAAQKSQAFVPGPARNIGAASPQAQSTPFLTRPTAPNHQQRGLALNPSSDAKVMAPMPRLQPIQESPVANLRATLPHPSTPSFHHQPAPTSHQQQALAFDTSSSTVSRHAQSSPSHLQISIPEEQPPFSNTEPSNAEAWTTGIAWKEIMTEAEKTTKISWEEFMAEVEKVTPSEAEHAFSAWEAGLGQTSASASSALLVQATVAAPSSLSGTLPASSPATDIKPAINSKQLDVHATHRWITGLPVVSVETLSKSYNNTSSLHSFKQAFADDSSKHTIQQFGSYPTAEFARRSEAPLHGWEISEVTRDEHLPYNTELYRWEMMLPLEILGALVNLPIGRSPIVQRKIRQILKDAAPELRLD